MGRRVLPFAILLRPRDLRPEAQGPRGTGRLAPFGFTPYFASFFAKATKDRKASQGRQGDGGLRFPMTEGQKQLLDCCYGFLTDSKRPGGVYDEISNGIFSIKADNIGVRLTVRPIR